LRQSPISVPLARPMLGPTRRAQELGILLLINRGIRVLTAKIRPLARATRPCRHARSRCTETGGPRGVCGRARAIASRASCAPRTDDRSASSLAGRPCLIIGVRECGYETGNIVRRASVEATSVVGDRARVRRFRRIRSVRISGRPAQTAAELAGACGQAASHPRIGGTAVPSPGLSEQASN
jgi:hypothetical protein